MRNKAVLLGIAVIIALVSSCDSGAKKEAFDLYEAQVSDVLGDESELRTRYEEEYANMSAYGRVDAFNQLVRQKVIPFYDEMDKMVSSVSPEDEELRRVHGLLVQYVALCQELFRLDTESVDVGDMEKPALERLNKAMDLREKATRELDEALRSVPELMQKLVPMFKAEQQATISVVQSLQMVRSGEASAAEFLKGMDDQIDPFYEKLVKQLAGMVVSPAEQAAMLKAKAYLGTTMAFFIAAREMAALRPEMDAKLIPLRERLQELQTETKDMLREYRTQARAYRDSLR